MPALGHINLTAISFTVALHAMVVILASDFTFDNLSKTKQPPEEQIVLFRVLPPSPVALPSSQPEPSRANETLRPETPNPSVRIDAPSAATSIDKPVASMAAPPPPTAQEWDFAGKYTNKNSKGYRYSWGKQVRSMMGTAVEGPDQGYVRFRIEIAPDGTLAKLDTLWTTSAVAEQLARKAIQSMPLLPPTPTGQPLIFEKTIAFTPFALDDPPSYKDDCLPDPPAFRNPFVWDGKSPQVRAVPPKPEKLDPKALEECLRQLPKDTIEAEMARDRREMERWGWTK